MSGVDRNISILLLGPESCGKTLLSKSLQHFARAGCVWELGAIPKHGRPTLGVELTDISIPISSNGVQIKKSSRIPRTGVSVTIRELGGQLSPLWTSHIQENEYDGLIYCIDSLNPFQASRASVELARLLNNSKLREMLKGLLLVFTKSADFGDEEVSSNKADPRMSVVELRNMMLLDDILDDAAKQFPSVEIITKCSAVSGTGLTDILAWIKRIATN